MRPEPSRWQRLGLITALVERAPGQVLGRTAIVKLVYLLQSLRGVEAGYDFSLYSYGPFTSAILNDLDYAAFLKAVEVRTVPNAVGFGYEIRPGPAAGSWKEQAASWLQQYHADIDWVAKTFGSRSATDLELLATLIYADRELAAPGKPVPLAELVRLVRGVKPRFSEGVVTAQAEAAQANGWLRSVAPSANRASS
jgi:hypothetical protein